MYSPLFRQYISLYIGSLSIPIKKHNEAKVILTSLLEENNSEFLHDSVRSKIYHNLSVVYGNEGNQQKRLIYVIKSYELEKNNLSTNHNYANYNISVNVYATQLYNKFKQNEKAYHLFQEALSQPFNQSVNINNHGLIGNYVDLLYHMGMNNKAEKYIDDLEHFYLIKSQHFINEYVSLLNGLAKHARNQKNYTKAIHLSTRVLSITKLNQSSTSVRSYAINTLANCYYDLQQYDKMWYYAKRDIEESKNNNKRSLLTAYTFMAKMSAKLQLDEMAYLYIDSAKYTFDKYSSTKESKRVFENTIALSYLELEQYTQALYHLENIADILNKDKNYTPYLKIDNQYEQAICYSQTKKYNKAYRLLTEANSNLRNLYPYLYDKNSNIHDTKTGILYRNINMKLAQNQYRWYKQNGDLELLQESEKILDIANASLQRFRNKQTYDRDRLVSGEQFYDFTLLSTRINMALYNKLGGDKYIHKIYENIQSSKAHALTQGVAEKQYKLNSGVPIELINAINQFKEQYDRYEIRYNEAVFSNNADSSTVSYFSSQMNENMAKIDSLNKLIEGQYPSSKYDNSINPFPTIEKIQQRLKENQVVIDYYQTEEELFRCTINKFDYQFDIIPIGDEFNKAMELVTEEISTPFIGQHGLEHMQAFANASYKLYTLLFDKTEPLTDDKELIIVPHGVLSYLPFEVLLTKDCSKQKPRFKNYPWLIKKQAISYLYNTALFNDEASEPATFSKVIAFAPQYYGKLSSDSIQTSTSLHLDSLLMPLSGAKKEIKSIKKSFTTKAFIGPTANKRNFIDNMQKNAILHLAMHTLNNEIQPFNSQLVFASEDSISGSFKARELYNYSIKSPLAILSACSTGYGNQRKGEGLLSIARAFTYAGVESQIMTLWPVNDQSGADITERLYAQLETGLTKNKALQASKLAYISQADGIKSHPYYWANYILAGNTSPIQQKMPKGIFVYLLAFAMLSVILLFLYDRKRKH
ncbi:CHAT domain-containing protein [uncultured Carboxylicivirga sp.]|nr:CHAT domain-containing protein [uncultured Carboxylicivirga sp.]